MGARWCTTFSKLPQDEAAAKRAMDWCFNWMVNPIFGIDGDYPESMREEVNILEQREQREILPRFTEEQIEELKGDQDQNPVCFCGNY